MTRLFLLLLSTFIFFGCATPLKESLNQVKPGMDKDDVLELNGSPWLTRRANSQDTWVYRFYEENQEYHQFFLFEQGRVIKVSSARPHPDPKSKLQEAGSMESYKEAVKQKQKAYNSGFKDVDSSHDDDD